MFLESVSRSASMDSNTSRMIEHASVIFGEASSVIDGGSFTSGDNEAFLSHDGQVLRGISLGHTHGSDHLPHRKLSVLQKADYLQSLRIGQGLADLGLQFKYFEIGF